MNKFVTGLVQDATGIKKQRATSLGKETADAQIDLIRALEKEKRDLENELMNLTDLSPENEFDLRPTSKNFNASTWVAKLQEIKVSLLEVQIQLNVAFATQKEWFEENATGN
jgi:hypothetical protein